MKIIASIRQKNFGNDKNISLKSIASISIIMSFIFTVGYANTIFYQFGFINILLLAVVFLTILYGLLLFFDKTYFKEKIYFNVYTTISAIIIVFFLTLIASTALTDAVYYRAFPLLEADLGLGVHPDSSYHVSLIQSIMTFGYPSTAQHGIPIKYYHALSHYIDALILTITHLDPYDAYGLMYYFKVITFLSSILIFTAQVLKKSNLFIFIISFLLLSPMIVSTWTPIFSHALWFTSILTVLSAFKIYTLLTKEEKYTNKDYIFLFLFILLIGVGKVSLGFIYATFIGMYLLLKNWKDYQVYIMGFGWIIFFFVFPKFMRTGTSNSLSFDSLSFDLIYNFIFNVSQSPYGMLQSIYTSIFILSIMAALFRTKQNLFFVISSLFSLSVLSFLIISREDLIYSDIFYFEYSLAFILILMMFQTIFNNLATLLQKTIALIVLVCLSSLYYLPKVNILSLSPSLIKQSIVMLNYRPFVHINRMSTNKEKYSFSHGGLSKEWLEIQKRPLFNFKTSLEKYMKSSHLSKRNTFLFMPKEIFEKDLNFLSSKKWSIGLFIYASTGIPLIYANKQLIKGYGYRSYTEKSLWVSMDDFDPKKVCNMHLSDTIVIVEKFWTPQFSIVNCNKIN